MKSGLDIRTMTPEDLEFAATCADRDGWASGCFADFEAALAYDPAGCWVVQAGDVRVGVGVAILYGSYGRVGSLAVVPEFRRRGIGTLVLAQAVEYLAGRGASSVVLDMPSGAAGLGERSGFRRICRLLRLGGRIEGCSDPRVRRMRASDLEAVAGLDREAFHADRRFFLEWRQSCSPEPALVLEGKRGIEGYIMGRTGPGEVVVGPWVVRPGTERPEGLLLELARRARSPRIHLSLLESNGPALETVRRLGLQEQGDPPWRMLRGMSAFLGASHDCFALGSAVEG